MFSFFAKPPPQRRCVQFVAPNALQIQMIEDLGYRLDHRDGDNYYFWKEPAPPDQSERERLHQGALSIGRRIRQKKRGR
jgi:hypothetical protein